MPTVPPPEDETVDQLVTRLAGLTEPERNAALREWAADHDGQGGSAHQALLDRLALIARLLDDARAVQSRLNATEDHKRGLHTQRRALFEQLRTLGCRQSDIARAVGRSDMAVHIALHGKTPKRAAAPTKKLGRKVTPTDR